VIERPAKPRLATIDFLRGVAAFSVAWFHFTNGVPGFLQNGALKASGVRGWLGVEVFFVISGFVIPYSLHRGGYQLRLHWKRFLAKRLIRLDPPYVACIVLVVGLGYLSARTPGFHGKPPHYTWSQLALHLGYLNAWFGGDWVNPVFWTLAVEFQFYLVIALIYPLLSSGRAVVRIASLVVMALVALTVPSTALAFHWLCLFGVGIIAFQYFVGLIGPRTLAGLLAGMGGVCFVVLGGLVTAVGLTTALLITFVRIRPTRVFTFLGAISYSLYLLHVPIGGRVVNLGMRLRPTPFNHLLILAGSVLSSVLAAYLFYKLIELPAQRWSGRLSYFDRADVNPSGSPQDGLPAPEISVSGQLPRVPTTVA